MAFCILIMSCMSAGWAGSDLVGKILDQNGKPVSGAQVFIYTASVRIGTSPYCPSCYLDCRKSASSDANGGFLISNLDPSLLFRVLVVKEGFEPRFVINVDPFKGPIKAELKPIDPRRLEAGVCIRGRVLGPDNKPVVGAQITPQSFKTEAHSGFSPGIFDPVAITNLSGEFVLTSKSPIEYVSVVVEARGLASAVFKKISPSPSGCELRLGKGVDIKGQVVLAGRPLAGVSVGIVQQDRNADGFLGDSGITTDANGEFLLSNVHPNERYFLYGTMTSLKRFGSIPVKEITTRNDGSVFDAGKLEVVTGHRLEGRVILGDGNRVPVHTRIIVSRDKAWDSQILELDEDGRFSASGLPTEIYSLVCRIKGFKLSDKNACASPYNPGQLEGLIDCDVTDLTIAFEPGEASLTGIDHRSPGFWENVKEFRSRRARLIRGIDPAR